jgi:hypothetical protein
MLSSPNTHLLNHYLPLPSSPSSASTLHFSTSNLSLIHVPFFRNPYLPLPSSPLSFSFLLSSPRPSLPYPLLLSSTLSAVPFFRHPHPSLLSSPLLYSATDLSSTLPLPHSRSAPRWLSRCRRSDLGTQNSLSYLRVDRGGERRERR